MTEIEARPLPGSALRGFSAGVILVGGVILVPFAITVLFTSYSEPDAAAYVRMAFAQVAGATIALITVLGLLLHRIVRRSPSGIIAWFAFLAIAIGSWQVSNVGQAASALLTRLSSLD